MIEAIHLEDSVAATGRKQSQMAGMARATEESPDFTSGAGKEPPLDIGG